MGKDVIIACDFPDRERVLGFLDQFRDERPYVKIGMELFYAAGPDIVREIKARGHSVFLDLKLCDIPNTVNHAMRVLRDLGADMINLHAFGTQKMMAAAVDGLTRPDGTRPLLIAVTQLTSTDETRMRTVRWRRSCCTTRRTRATRGWTAWSARRWRRAGYTRTAARTFSP